MRFTINCLISRGEFRSYRTSSKTVGRTTFGSIKHIHIRCVPVEILMSLSETTKGGSDTLSGGISWTIHLLSQHPEWQEQLRQEVLPIVAMDMNSQVNQLDTSPILDHVVRESLRLAPPVHGTISKNSSTIVVII